MQLVSIGGKPVAYHVVGYGAGTPLLVINGGPGFAHGFLHLSIVWERLAEARRVVFFDQPGTGQSWPVGPNDSLVVQDILRSIEAIRETIGAPRLAMLGHSWGGYVALAYAVNHPDHVERVVLVASVPPNLSAISATKSLSRVLYPERMAAQAGLSADNPDDVQTYIRGQLAMSFYSPEVRDRVLAGLGVVAYSGRQETLLWKDAEAHDLTRDLNRLRMPVLVTTGRFDHVVTSWQIHQGIPGSQFAVWERSGHFPMIEEPDAFFAVVDRFLRGGR